MSQFWTEEEVNLLRALAGEGKPLRAAVKALPLRSYNAVARKARLEGIKFRPTHFVPWEEGETALILEITKTHYATQALPFFPGRNIDSIQRKAIRLGVRFQIHPRSALWTEEETNALREALLEGKTLQETTLTSTRSATSLRHKAKELGLHFPHRIPANHWSDEDLKFLRQHAEEMSREDLADYFGRKKTAVTQIARRRGIKLKPVVQPRMWSEAEDNLLTKRFRGAVVKDLAKDLNRSVHAVHRRAKHLGVRREKRVQKTSWTALERVTLELKYKVIPTVQISEILNRSIAAIHRQARVQGLANKVEKRPWTKSDDLTLKKKAGVWLPKKIAKTLNRSLAAIQRRAGHKRISLRSNLYALQDLELLLNPFEGEVWFNQHTYRDWRLVGLSHQTQGPSRTLVNSDGLRKFWKERPEAIDIYGLDEATVEELSIDLETWPEPPNFKVIACVGKGKRHHKLTLNSFDLYEKHCQCSCGKKLSRWAHAYTNEDLRNAPITYYNPVKRKSRSEARATKGQETIEEQFDPLKWSRNKRAKRN